MATVSWTQAAEQFGGETRVRELARQAGYTSGAASNWKKRNAIPARSYHDLQALVEHGSVQPSSQLEGLFSPDQLYTSAVEAVTKLTTEERWDLINKLRSLLEHLVQWNREGATVETPKGESQLDDFINRLKGVEKETGGQGPEFEALLADIRTLLARGLAGSEPQG